MFNFAKIMLKKEGNAQLFPEKSEREHQEF